MTLNPDQARSLLSTFIDEDGIGLGGAGGIPDRIGSYDIIRLLGVGGMGMVFEATQAATGRHVALKLIRANIVSTGALRRFQHEVRMLARLQHPGIAQIYEAGAEDGPLGPQPYFAMELVDGQPLTDHAVDHDLTTRDRLLLFLAVCRALEYAHQRGIIHRDLKPTNILVDGDGEPKVLDFGVARTTDAESAGGSVLNTRTGQLLGTLPYMSPEQTTNGIEAMDTRSDVYALGVILYELLTDRLPYELKGVGLPAAARVIQEQDPVPPRTIHRTLAGDVSTIVLKALEKTPDRRYQSAAALAADIERHLNDEPILARPSSPAYALRKFAKRNKALAIGLVIASLGLGAGLVSGTWLFAKTLEARQDARMQEEAARVQADAMRAVSLVLTDLINSADPVNAGRDARVLDVLRHADSILASPLVNHPRIELAVRTTLGRVYLALADFADAEVHLREAMRIGEDHLSETDATRLLAQSAFASFLYERERLDEAEAMARDVFAKQEDTLGSQHADTIETLALIGRIETEQGYFTAGFRTLDEALGRAVVVHGDSSRICNGIRLDMARALRRDGRLEAAAALSNDVYQRQLLIYGESDPLTIETLIEVGHIALNQDSDPARITETLWLAYSRAARVLGRDHPITADALFLLARASLENSDLDASEEFLRDVFNLRRDTLGTEHSRTRSALRLLADVLIEQGLTAEAEPFIELYLNTEPPDSDSDQAIEAKSQLAYIRVQAGSLDSALELYQDVLDAREASNGPTHLDTLTALRNVATTLAALHRPAEAEPLFLRAINGWESENGLDHPRAVGVMTDYARFLDQAGRADETDAVYRRLVDAAARAYPEGFTTRAAVLKSEYGRFLLRVGRHAEAERYLLDAFTTFQGTLDLDEPVVRETSSAIIELYRSTGQDGRRRAFERQLAEP